jgi:hypothetical protein
LAEKVLRPADSQRPGFTSCVVSHRKENKEKKEKPINPVKHWKATYWTGKKKYEAGRFKVAPGVYICRGFKFFD